MNNNVILITIDCLRADHLGCYGYAINTSPNIDKLAKRGLIFKNAFSNGSTTKSSFPSIFSSNYALSYRGFKKFSKRRPHIAEILSNNGYKTAGFHSNPYLSNKYGFQRGFFYFYDSLDDEEVITRQNAEKLTKKVITWINENKDNNFFLWVHYMDVHIPYNPPDGYLNKLGIKISDEEKTEINRNKTLCSDKPKINKRIIQNLISLYDGCIRYMDEYVGLLLDKLKEFDLMKNTMIILTADHGDEFMEHGHLSHKLKLYDELIHVPMIIFHPNMKSAKINGLVESIDIPPTMLDFLELDIPKNFKGKSIIDMLKSNNFKTYIIGQQVYGLRGTYCSDPDVLSMDNSSSEKQICCRTEKWKLIYQEKFNSYELYDLENDPKETKNIFSKNVKVFMKLKKIIKKHINDEILPFVKEGSLNKEKLDKKRKIKKRLEALGYI